MHICSTQKPQSSTSVNKLKQVLDAYRAFSWRQGWVSMAEYFTNIKQSHGHIHYLVTGERKKIITHYIVTDEKKVIILLPSYRAKRLTT